MIISPFRSRVPNDVQRQVSGTPKMDQLFGPRLLRRE